VTRHLPALAFAAGTLTAGYAIHHARVRPLERELQAERAQRHRDLLAQYGRRIPGRVLPIRGTT
jgi:hypothetical protein